MGQKVKKKGMVEPNPREESDIRLDIFGERGEENDLRLRPTNIDFVVVIISVSFKVFVSLSIFHSRIRRNNFYIKVVHFSLSFFTSLYRYICESENLI